MSGSKGAPTVVVGLGQLGELLTAGLRDRGREVIEVRRGDAAVLEGLDAAELVLVCVAEDDLAAAVAAVPPRLRSRVGLVQNELVPATWRELGVAAPTVAVVWFEKKAGRDAIPLLSTPVAGPSARLVCEAITAQGLPATTIDPGDDLTRALVAKNLYILVANLGGLAGDRTGAAPGGASWPTGVTTMGELWGKHERFARALGGEILAIDAARMGAGDAAAIAGDVAWSTFRAAVAADPAHGCRGRTAPARLARTLARARRHEVEAPILEALAAGG